MKVKVLRIFLTILFFFYGISFTKKNTLDVSIKYLGRCLFILASLWDLHVLYNSIFEESSLIEILGYSSDTLSIISTGISLIIKSKLIIKFVFNHLKLLTSFHIKIIVFCISITLLNSFSLFVNSIVGLSEQFRYFNNITVQKESSIEFATQDYFTDLIFRPYYEWTSYGATIYGIMYFMMYLKHDKILNCLLLKKEYSYLVIFKTLHKFETDIEHFDNLVTYLPAIYLVNVFLAMNLLIIYLRTGSTIQVITSIFGMFIVWPVTYFVVNIFHSKIKKKIYQLRYLIATESQQNETKGNLLKLLDLMSNVHVTAGHLIRLDKEFILPYIGSMFTYTFLFSDKFDTKKLN